MRCRPVTRVHQVAHFDAVGQILVDLGVKKMRLMTAPKVIHGLAGFGLEVVDYISGEN